MIKKVAHLADIHFQNDLTRLNEQNHIVDLTIKSIQNDKPDLIVIAGDLFHNYVKPINEIKKLSSDFLYQLTEIADVVIIDGNHDLMKSNLDRISSIKTLIDIQRNKKIHYFDKTGFFELDNIMFAVWYHPDRKSPWIETHTRNESKFYIDLFHDPIANCKLQNGDIYTEKNSVDLNDFKGDIVMAGDIHLQQSFQKDGKEFFAYPSSLYCGNFGEGDNKFHGYLLWDISDKTFELKPIISKYQYYNIYITLDYNYDDINIKLEQTGEFNFIKIHWRDDVSTYTIENKNKIKKYLQVNYKVTKIVFDTSKIPNKKLFIENIKTDFNINDENHINETFVEILKNKGYDEEFINEVLLLDKQISELVPKDEKQTNSEWKVRKIIIDNFKSHGEEYELDLEDMNGIIQIFGENQIGKCVHPDTKIKIRYDKNKILDKLKYLPEFLKLQNE